MNFLFQNSAEMHAQIIYVTYEFHTPTVLQHSIKPAVITCYTGMSITFQQENHYFGLPTGLAEFCIAHLVISKTQVEKSSINQILDRKKKHSALLSTARAVLHQILLPAF